MIAANFQLSRKHFKDLESLKDGPGQLPSGSRAAKLAQKGLIQIHGKEQRSFKYCTWRLTTRGRRVVDFGGEIVTLKYVSGAGLALLWRKAKGYTSRALYQGTVEKGLQSRGLMIGGQLTELGQRIVNLMRYAS